MPDNSTIGRHSSCSIILRGREESRLHARVFFSQGEVLIETVSKINNVSDEAVFGNEDVKEDDVDAIEHFKYSGSDRESSHVLWKF